MTDQGSTRANRRRALRVRRLPVLGVIGAAVDAPSADSLNNGATGAEAVLAALLALLATGLTGAGTAAPSGRVAHSTADWFRSLTPETAVSSMGDSSSCFSCEPEEADELTSKDVAEDGLLAPSR